MRMQGTLTSLRIPKLNVCDFSLMLFLQKIIPVFAFPCVSVRYINIVEQLLGSFLSYERRTKELRTDDGVSTVCL